MTHFSQKTTEILDKIQIDHQASEDNIYYLGFLECFNQQLYFEAHDVLEKLWLRTHDSKKNFYKGLIQVAGAYVHFKRGTLHPGERLLKLAAGYLKSFAPTTDGLNIKLLLQDIEQWLILIEKSERQKTPYDPTKPPQLKLLK